MSVLADWVTALESRHLADLRIPEVTRALRALSSTYIERRRKPGGTGARDRQQVIGALDSAGKRAAFALFYAPLHFIAVCEVIQRLAAGKTAPKTILDLGCGTGAGGAAWAVTAGAPAVVGIDRHPWAVAEAQWTYRQLRVPGRARQGDVTRTVIPRKSVGVLACYVLNELSDEGRASVEGRLLETAKQGGQVLIVEPLARGVVPWWDQTAARFLAIGGRSDEWRLPTDLPPLLRLLDHAAGLDHRELTFRTIYV